MRCAHFPRRYRPRKEEYKSGKHGEEISERGKASLGIRTMRRFPMLRDSREAQNAPQSCGYRRTFSSIGDISTVRLIGLVLIGLLVDVKPSSMANWSITDRRSLDGHRCAGWRNKVICLVRRGGSPIDLVSLEWPRIYMMSLRETHMSNSRNSRTADGPYYRLHSFRHAWLNLPFRSWKQMHTGHAEPCPNDAGNWRSCWRVTSRGSVWVDRIVIMVLPSKFEGTMLVRIGKVFWDKRSYCFFFGNV